MAKSEDFSGKIAVYCSSKNLKFPHQSIRWHFYRLPPDLIQQRITNGGGNIAAPLAALCYNIRR